jgi:hypothetical protein
MDIKFPLFKKENSMLYIILTIAVLLLIATKSLSLFKRKLKKTLS